jgi:hypothetical protein
MFLPHGRDHVFATRPRRNSSGFGSDHGKNKPVYS